MTFGGNKRENKISTMKNGWESELGYSSSRCGRHGGAERRRGPGSTLSAESDIRFTRRKLSRSCRGCCAALAAFLVFLLVAAVVIYLGHLYLFRDPLNKQIFRAAFRVLDDTWSDEAIDPASEPYLVKERDYKERLNLLFQKSELRSTYDGTEILALDSSGNDMIVHFDVYFDPIFTSVDVRDVEEILVREIELGPQSQFFGNISIDRDSFHIEESEAILNAPVTISSASNIVTTTVVPTVPPPPRECSPINLVMCKHLPYNMTSFPNAVGHASLKELEEDMIAYRELIDAECYSLAYDFVCQLLQPSCFSGTDEDRLVLPCRSYCREFYAGCGNRLPERLKKKINCSKFPDYHGLTSCRPRADCTANLQSRALSPRICDGVPDCEDMSDETSCRYCTPGHVHCGLTKKCIPLYKQCDGTRDCPDGSDERSCLIIEPSLVHMRQLPSESTFPHRLYSHGYVVFNEQGNVGKVCAGSYNESEKSLNTVATSLCHSLSFRNVDSVEIKIDDEQSYNYVEIEDPFAAEIEFLKTTCPSKQVLHVGCSDFDCGKQSARTSTGIDNLGRMAQYGDWPWHAALFKEDMHVCDATLISAEWLATTGSCFQGQPKAEWVARLGSVRIMSTSPWQQERRIVGMVKSPVEGSTIALIKMEEPIFMSDFVRPICLPEMNVKNDMSTCNTLGWTRNRDHLRRIHLTVRPMDKCENVSIATVNSMCTEALYEQDDCDEEEFAGSSMVCLNPEAKRWSLTGLGNWRIACTKIGLGRPRMYDSMTSNVEWIKKTISATL